MHIGYIKRKCGRYFHKHMLYFIWGRNIGGDGNTYENVYKPFIVCCSNFSDKSLENIQNVMVHKGSNM